MRLLRPVWIVGLLFLFLGLIPSLVKFATDFFWYQEVGYEAVFTTELTTKTLRAFVGGRDVDLRNKQTELAKKYRERYRQLEAQGERK